MQGSTSTRQEQGLADNGDDDELLESEKGQGSNDGKMREFELKCDDTGN
jgi:hypothetical protein